MKRFALFIFMLLLIGCVETQKSLEGKKVLIVVAQYDFNYDEFSLVKDMLEKAGADVVTASKGSTAYGSGGEQISIDLNLFEFITAIGREKFNPEEFDAFIFLGGKGAITYFDDKIDFADQIIASIVKVGYETAVIAAIDNAPLIIAKYLPDAIVKDMEMTCNSTYENNLTQRGIKYTPNGVVIYKDIITASSKEYTEEFVKAIIRKLS